MEKDLQIKYSKALQEVQRERNALRAENEQLKQQLAEKEEELHSAKVGEEFALKCCNEANELLALQVAGQYQDKISFAVKQLEKVKENLIEDLFDLYRSPCLIYETYGDEYDSAIQDAINKTIDNQIKQLKEGK